MIRKLKKDAHDLLDKAIIMDPSNALAYREKGILQFYWIGNMFYK